MRKEPTCAEDILWRYLRGGQQGVKFRRQQPVGPYIVDFYCAPLRFVIEADGGQHVDGKDHVRDKFLRDDGIFVLRFWNNDILENTEGVFIKIRECIDFLMKKSPPP